MKKSESRPGAAGGDVLARLQAHGVRATPPRLRIADGTRSCFDSNVEAHYHFHDEATGALTDVALPEVQFSRLPPPPDGMEVAGLDLVIRLRPTR